jgi:hypothetical protein
VALTRSGNANAFEELVRRHQVTIFRITSQAIISPQTFRCPRNRVNSSADRDDHSTGRPLVCRPTPRLLQLIGAETLEEARGRMGVPADYGGDQR